MNSVKKILYYCNMNNKHIFIIALVALVFFSNWFNYFIKDIEEERKHYDVIISINVHENLGFLQKQLENIKENVNCNYAVILNCNYHMFNECKLNISQENIYIHDKILNKRTWHGSLTEGIYNNMCYATEHFTFDYFTVASRNFFGNNMTLEELNRLTQNGKPMIDNKWENKLDKDNWEESFNTWHWPLFAETLLAQYFIERGQGLYSSPHEGLLFTGNGCVKIVEFLEYNQEIKIDLFSFEGCVEEFSLQSIAMNVGEPYFYIGNGCYNKDLESNDPDSDTLRFMYKVDKHS